MIHEIRRDNIEAIRNPSFSAYAAIYLDIEQNFKDQISNIGLGLDDSYVPSAREALIERLVSKGAVSRNDGKSIYINRISPACVACRESIKSATFFISLQCKRDCFYCFNPNQEHYTYFSEHTRDVLAEINQISNSGQTLEFAALTGGEPLLHLEESTAFFNQIHSTFDDLHSRLYTSGEPINEDMLSQLGDAGLKEIRFSLRLHEGEISHQATLENIRLAKKYIPSVMVEMPIFPDCFDVMRDILVTLDQIEISSINLLELCFPFQNVEAFRMHGFKIRYPPYQVLYEYWYAGGLPIAGSEEACLRLIEFALDQELSIGVHYCSLENKHTGQVYQMNVGKKVSPRYHLSERDFFLKTAKVFGMDIPSVRTSLKRRSNLHTFTDSEHKYLEFNVSHIPALSELDVEVGVCSSIVEEREEGTIVRELKVQWTRPAEFNLDADI